MANLYSVPLKNSVQHTLAGTLTQAETSTITLDSSVVLELQATSSMKGLLVIDRVDVKGASTPTKTEYIAYTGVSGSTVTGLTRGLAGTSAQGHAIGAIVEFVPDVTWAQAINDVFTTQHNDDGTHKTLSSISLASVTFRDALGINVSLATGAINNFYINNTSLASSTIFNSTMDSFTFKSPISNVTQGDLIAFNGGKFERLTGTIGNVLTMTSTASGLLPSYVAQTIPTAASIKYSDLTSTGPITTTRVLVNGSNVTISVTTPATLELSAAINHSFNNTAGAYYFQFSNGSTLVGPNYNFIPIKANAIGTANILHAISLASGINVIGIQGRTDGNQLTIYDGTITTKVIY